MARKGCSDMNRSISKFASFVVIVTAIYSNAVGGAVEQKGSDLIATVNYHSKETWQQQTESAAKVFYDLRFVWYNGCELGDGH